MRLPTTWLASLLALTTAALVACSATPKPRELEAFERLRADPRTRAASTAAPGIMRRADRLLNEARNKWETDDLEDSRHLALLGTAKVNEAIALAEQKDAKDRIKKGRDALEDAEADIDKLERDLDATKVQLGLLENLEKEKREQDRLKAEMERQQKRAEEEKLALAEKLQGEKARAEAADKVKAAEVALKEADAVQASKYAADAYKAAVAQLDKARSELAEGKIEESRISADVARQKAAAAANQAKPEYSRVAAQAAKTAQAEALNRDAAAIPQIEVRRDTQGALQRLVLHIPASQLFRRSRDTHLTAGSEGVLGSVAQLLKKYKDFPVQVVGHTHKSGRQDVLFTRSRARAESVYSFLLSQGVDAKRMVIMGKGAEEMLSTQRNRSARERNNRVEVIFMYQ